MSSPVISVENLSKSYRLGQIGTGTLTNDLRVWAAKLRGRPNPLLKIGQEDHGNRDGEELWALKDVSFTVEQGEVLGIIGKNGAGKSTLLKILSRVTAPTGGRVKVKGRIASLLEVGTGFHPDLTGRENIFLNGAILGMSRDEVRRKFDEIVDFAEVEKFIDTPVKRYSSGMYVRLAFAVAAHLEPEILLVDEVLAVGDAEFQKKCLGKMGDVAKQGRTVLFVSHNMAAVQTLCPKSLLLDKGKISFSGPSTEVVSKYLTNGLDEIQQTNNLEDWPKRSGNGNAKIVCIELFNGQEKPITQIAYDESIKIRLTCRFYEEIEASFGVLINSVFDVPLIDLRSNNDSLITGKLFGTVVVDVDIDELNLYPGDYLLSPWIADRMIKEDIDYVRSCSKLTVTVPTKFEGHLQLDPNWGSYIVNSHWKIIL